MRKMLSLFMALLFLSVPLFSITEEVMSTMVLSAADSDIQTLGRELIVTGSRIWQVVDATLLCRDASSGDIVASLPLVPDLPGDLNYTEQLSGKELYLYRFSLLSGREDTVFLCCAYLDADGDCSVRLLEFGLDADNRIVIRSGQDRTDSLGIFYTLDSGFIQVEMVSFSGGILVTAIDEDFYCHLCWVSPDFEEITELGLLPYDMLTAILPWGDQLLLAGDSLTSESVLSLATLSLPEGDLNHLAEIPSGSSASAQNFAWDPETNQLFFTLYNAAWRVALQDGQTPEPIAVFPEEPASFGKGAIADEQYFFQSEDGELLSCNTRAVLSATPLRIINGTENTAVGEAAARFNAAQKEYFLFVENMNQGSSPQEKSEMFQQADGAILSLASPECKTLLRRKICMDLSVSPLLSEAVSGMEKPVRKALSREGAIIAFPVSLDTPCLTLNIAAMKTLIGLAPEELPRDWEGFLALLARMAESGCFDAHPEYAISMPGMTAEEFRQIMAIYLLRSVLLDAFLQEDPSVVIETLPPLLAAFQSVSWHLLGLPKDSEETDDLDSEALPVIGEQFFGITTAYWDPEIAFWPLSATAKRDPVIPQQITVLVLNQDSEYPDALLQWAESLWEQSEVSFRMCLCPQMQDPIPNDEYQSTVEELEDILRQYESWLEVIIDPDEAEIVRSEADELLDYLESYRAEAKWIVSEESLSAYRSRMFAPDPYAFWESEEDLNLLDSWLAGELSDENLISWIRMLLSET